MEKNEKLIRYSMQLAYLHTLLSAKLITENEYSRIKKKLQKDYKVPSDILADFESRDVRQPMKYPQQILIDNACSKMYYLIEIRQNEEMPKISKSESRDIMENTVILPEDQKIISMKELKEIGLSQYMVAKLVDDGKLIKLNKSYYEITGYRGEESDFYYAEAYAPNGVICLLSAAAHYNLTTYIPDAIDVAIPRKAKVSTMPDWPKMNVHYYTDERYALGINTVEEGGNQYQIYDMEKTVVDIVFYREKVGIEDTKEVLLTYLQRKDRNLNRLLKYAELMKCGKVMRGYLEVLV